MSTVEVSNPLRFKLRKISLPYKRNTLESETTEIFRVVFEKQRDANSPALNRFSKPISIGIGFRGVSDLLVIFDFICS